MPDFYMYERKLPDWDIVFGDRMVFFRPLTRKAIKWANDGKREHWKLRGIRTNKQNPRLPNKVMRMHWYGDAFAVPVDDAWALSFRLGAEGLTVTSKMPKKSAA